VADDAERASGSPCWRPVSHRHARPRRCRAPRRRCLSHDRTTVEARVCVEVGGESDGGFGRHRRAPRSMQDDGRRAAARGPRERQRVWTFAIEEYLINAALKNELKIGGGFPKAPEAWSEVVAAFKQNHASVMAALESARDEDFFGTVKFFTGPGAVGDVPKVE